ncbi:patatin-like phospholipase family protein [Flavobacteriaceae bacterium M23B6Z8]
MKKHVKYAALVLVSILLSACHEKTENITEEVKTSTPKTIILAVDGGGIKGVIPAVFIQAIEQNLQKQSYQVFDLIGGTSTGGIISVALTSPNTNVNNGKLPFTGNAILDIYKNNGSKIFVAQCSSFDLKCRAEYATYIAHGTGSHSHQGIQPYMQSLLGVTTKLTDTKRFIDGLNGRVKQMFTTSYTVNSKGDAVKNPKQGTDYGPYLFNWYDAQQSSTHDYFVWEAGRGTSAAPTYFPIARAGGNANGHSPAAERWVVDGGMMSNDPALWGVTEALRTGIAKSLDDIIVISLGTGLYPGSAGVGIHNNKGLGVPAFGNWGPEPWLTASMKDLKGNSNSRATMIEIILDAVQLVTDDQLNAMQKAGLTYLRLEPALTLSQSQMDDISPANIASLEATAKSYIQSGEGQNILNKIITVLKNN